MPSKEVCSSSLVHDLYDQVVNRRRGPRTDLRDEVLPRKNLPVQPAGSGYQLSVLQYDESPSAPLVTDVHSSDSAIRLCPLCGVSAPPHVLVDHLAVCSANVVSCEFCQSAVAHIEYEEHMLLCVMNRRECYICRRRIPLAEISLHLRSCAEGRELVMFHGTSPLAAQQIVKSGFRSSPSGLLGAGVYLSCDIQKARRYGEVILECSVRVGRVAVIDRPNHPLQRTWWKQGFEAAWIPPDCAVGKTGEEEHCVYDERRVIFVRRVAENS